MYPKLKLCDIKEMLGSLKKVKSKNYLDNVKIETPIKKNEY